MFPFGEQREPDLLKMSQTSRGYIPLVIISLEVCIPGLVKAVRTQTSAFPFSHPLVILLTSKSQGGCSPASIAPAFQAGRRGMTHGKKADAPVLFQRACWKLSSVTSTYISLTSSVSYCIP